jgi:hypothetical protein
LSIFPFFYRNFKSSTSNFKLPLSNQKTKKHHFEATPSSLFDHGHEDGKVRTAAQLLMTITTEQTALFFFLAAHTALKQQDKNDFSQIPSSIVLPRDQASCGTQGSPQSTCLAFISHHSRC